MVEVYATPDDPSTATSLINSQLEKRGLGVIVHSSGLIVTNLHTISFAKKIAVELNDHTIFSGKILRVLPEYDLVLLKIYPKKRLFPIAIDDANKIQPGETIINVGGSPLLKNTISEGKVIGIGQDPTDHEAVLLKVKIRLYRGDSGGPLLNQDGKLIGMVMGKIKGRLNEFSIGISSNKIKFLCADFY